MGALTARGDTVGEMEIITSESELYSDDRLTLIDFYADWCGPCQVLGPIVEEIENEYRGRVRVVRVDVDEASGLEDEFEIMSIPTLVVADRGSEVGRITGVVPTDVLREMLDRHL